MNRKQKIMKRLQEHYDIVANRGHEIVGLFLQGSQNYNLDYENSDIDSKAILLPSLDSIVLSGKPISTTSVLENDEHIDLKDIRLMFECFKKQNINFVEILFTPFYILNPKYAGLFQPLLDIREQVARYNNYAAVNCMCGMSLEKYAALKHPYPATMDKIEKFGYCPKQFHHIVRLNEFIKRFVAGENYADCLISKDTEYLIDVKRGVHPLNEAEELAVKYCDDTKAIKNKYMAENPQHTNREVEVVMNGVLMSILKHYWKSELIENA